jgi:hypothetical protein
MNQEIRPCRSRPRLILEGAIEANRKERKEHKDKGIWLIFPGKRQTAEHAEYAEGGLGRSLFYTAKGVASTGKYFRLWLQQSN